MRIPEEVKRLFGQFQLTSLEYHKSPERMITAAARRMLQSDKEIVRSFILMVLADEGEVDLLLSVWQQTGANFYFNDGKQLREFFSLVEAAMRE